MCEEEVLILFPVEELSENNVEDTKLDEIKDKEEQNE